MVISDPRQWLIEREKVAVLGDFPDGIELEPKMDHAHAVVCSYIGCKTLLSHSVTETQNITFNMDCNDVLITRDGPISELLNVSIEYGGASPLVLDSTGLHEDLTVGAWTIGYRHGFARGAELTLSYLAGFTRHNVPAAVAEAIAATAVLLIQEPNLTGLSEKIGDWESRSYRTIQDEQLLLSGHPNPAM